MNKDAGIKAFSIEGNSYDTSSFSVQVKDEYIVRIAPENITLKRTFDNRAVEGMNLRAWDIPKVIELLETLQSHIDNTPELKAEIWSRQYWKDKRSDTK